VAHFFRKQGPQCAQYALLGRDCTSGEQN